MIKNDEDLNITEEEWQEFLEFMEKYEKSKENSILFIIYNKIKNLKKGKDYSFPFNFLIINIIVVLIYLFE